MKIYVVPSDDSTGAKVKAWVHNRWIDITTAVVEHPVIAVTIISGLTGVANTAIRAISKSNSLKKEAELKSQYIWDASLGHHWRIKKPLSTNQMLELERRRGMGESIGKILDDLKVL